MIHFLVWFCIGMATGTVIGSFFETTLHRLLVRQPLAGEADKTRQSARKTNRETGVWWTGPVCVSVGLMPFVVAAFFMQRWGIFCGAVVAWTLYYAAYEYAHWCTPQPKAKPMECRRIFRRLNAEQALHHRCIPKKFNGVLPLEASLPEIPPLRMELPQLNPRLSFVSNEKQKKRFNHARGYAKTENRKQKAEILEWPQAVKS